MIIAIVLGLFEHRLFTHGMETEALTLNRIGSIALLVCIYPLMTVGLFLLGFGHAAAGLSVLIAGIALVLVVAAVLFSRKLRTSRTERAQVAVRLGECAALGGEEYSALLERAFLAYDTKRSGELEMAQVRAPAPALCAHPADTCRLHTREPTPLAYGCMGCVWAVYGCVRWHIAGGVPASIALASIAPAIIAFSHLC